MPTLANYCGNDEFKNPGFCYANPLDLGRLYSIGSKVDVCCPPRKRARVSVPFLLVESGFESIRQPSIEVLPDECLLEIFRRLRGGRERSSCAGVSKRWLKVLTNIRKAEFSGCEDVETVSSDEDDGGCLTRCLEGKKATDLRLAAVAVGTSGRGGLGKLSVRGSNSVTDFGLSAVAHACPSLRSLSLWKVPYVGDEGLSEIARECHSLEKLDLSQCPLISNKSLLAIAQNCPHLTALNLESCSKISNDALQAIGKHCPKLQSISVKDCPLIGDHGVSSLVSSASALNKVKLHGLNITDFSLAVIGHYGKAITNLVLSNLQNVTERGFWVMGHAQGLQKLISLGITSCQGVTDLSLEAIQKGCINLKQIWLRRCRFISDNGLLAFSKAAGSLESLQLEECNGISLFGIVGVLVNSGTALKCLSLVKCMGIKDLAMEMRQPMPSACSSLRSLSVRNCAGFGNGGLAILGKLCGQLQHLDLSGLYGITDSGILPLLENCKAGLVKVNLSGCFNLTDEAVLALTTLHGETLEVLNLEGCRRITDVSLATIAENCLFLGDLDLARCAITDKGISALSRTEKLNLQVLSLSGCSEVSNKSIPSLKKLGKTLLGLNIQGCDLISGRMVELLTESLWRCDILS